MKYLSGTHTPEGEDIYQKWFYQQKNDVPEEISAGELEEVRSRIERRLLATIGAKSASRRQPLWAWYAVAATVVFGLVSSFWVGFTPRTHELISKTLHPSSIFIEKVNNSTSHLLVTLPDGSTVQLKQHSKLRYPARFASTKREVSLEGEAFFDVVRNTKSKFIITSQKVQTIVVGTSFNVRAYAGQATIEVRVVTGKVMVKDTVSHSLVTLLPMQRAVYEQRAHVLRKDTAQLVFQKESPWANSSEDEGELIFHNLPLDIAVALLHKKFGVQIWIENNSLMDSKVNGFFKDKMASEIIEAICQQTGSTCSKKGDQYVLSEGVKRAKLNKWNSWY